MKKRIFRTGILLLLVALLLTGCMEPAATKGPAEAEPTREPTQEQTESLQPVIQVADLDDGVIKVLAIGNSFTVDTVEYVYRIAESAGVSNIRVGKAVIPGASIDRHALNASLERANYELDISTDTGGWHYMFQKNLWEALETENWDYVVIQQHSPNAGEARSYGQLDYLLEHIQAHTHPDTQVLFHMTWAYQHNCTEPAFSTYKNDQMTMYSSIVSATETVIVPHEGIHGVIPTGTAIQNARTSYLGDALTVDGLHLNYEEGRYIAAMTFAAAVLGVDPDQVTYRVPGMSLQDLQVAVESVENAQKDPFTVTQSAFTQEDIQSNRIVKGTELKFTELIGEENGANGLTFYYTSDGKQLTPFTNPATGGNEGWVHRNGVLVYPVIVAEDNYGVAGSSASEYVVMGLQIPETGTAELLTWIALQGPAGKHGYRVKIALDSPDNVIHQYDNTGDTQNVIQNTYILEVTQGQTLYMIYEPLVWKNNEWFGYVTSLTYLEQSSE